MDFRQDHSQRQQQAQKIAPHLIHANLLLQCSNAELQQIIEREQNENPALDGDDSAGNERGCAQCPGLGSSACRTCPYAGQSTAQSDWLREDNESSSASAGAASGDGDDDSVDPLEDLSFSRMSASLDSDFSRDASSFDPILLAPAATSLSDHLITQMRAMSTCREDNIVAEFLVGSLDADGYLRASAEETTLALQLPLELIETGISRLQSCDPPGIGARDIQECLLIQIRHLQEEASEAEPNPLAECLIKNHWRQLVTHRHQEIREDLNVSEADLHQAIAYIRACLTPRPGAQFRQPWNNRPDTESVAVHPDVVIRQSPTGFDVEVMGFESLTLRINPYYRTLYDSLQGGRAHGHGARDSRLSPEHIRHILTCVERANLFLKNLTRRRNTIEKISRALIDCQLGYIGTGKRSFIRPLTRAQLGLMVSLHESTVSRALQHKYVQIPSGDVVPFDVFFGSVASAQEIISRLIAEENPQSPLSDQAIADALKSYGMAIARRTVVKYREDLRIPASYMRRPR